MTVFQRFGLFVLTIGALGAASAQAQTPQEAFDRQYARYEASVAELRRLRSQVPPAGPEREAVIAQFNKLVDELNASILPELVSATIAAYAATPNQNEKVRDFMSTALEILYEQENYDQLRKAAQLMIDSKHPEPRSHEMAGLAAFSRNDFEAAGKHFAAAKAAGQLSPGAAPYAQLNEKYKGLWAKEQKIREAEEKAGDLPRIKLETSKGEIVIELFENEAPGAVANFVHLVEKGYYDGLTFHRVLANFMAQGGCPTGSGTGGPGWAIRCECQKPEARMHFRGSLSMAHAGPDTGGSQFFLTFIPTDHLNGKHTVFGRVIEGDAVLDQLQRIDPSRPDPSKRPDKILKATVLRKRDHAYEPEKLPSRR